MNKSRKTLIICLLALFSFLVSFTLSNTEPENESRNTHTIPYVIIDSQAVDLLRGALDYLSELKLFSVQAQSTLEDKIPTGYRIDFEFSSSVTVSRPNKIHIERHGLGFEQIFYYNGKTLTLFNPSEKVYASEAAPGTIEDMFHFARDTYGISVPASDLLYSDAFSLLMEEVNYALLIGKEMIGEVLCYHLLFSRPGVDFQIWIADNGPPLIYKYVVTDTATPELLAFSTVLRNWNMAPSVSETLFEFVPTKDIEKIILLETN